MKLSLILGLLTVLFSNHLALANEEESFGEIKGEKLSLYYYDHSFSGHVNEQLVYAIPQANHGVLLSHRVGGRDVQALLKRSEPEFFVATIPSLTKEGKSLETKFVVTNINPREALIEGKLDQDAFSVKISAESVEAGHFANPRFDVKVGDKAYQFRLDNGHACIMCATKISYVVLSMLRVTGVL